MCEKCLHFGVLCNYDPNMLDLQPLPQAAEVVQLDNLTKTSPLSPTEHAVDLIKVSLEREDSSPDRKRAVMRFNASDLARLDKFQTRTVLTIGTKRAARTYQKEVVRLACTHRFLMHLVQSVTASHDRYLNGMSSCKPSPAEAYHMHQALTTFQTILSRPVLPEHRDSLFVAASLIGVVSFFNIEASSVEEVWPLQECDLGWLCLSDGKRAIWRLATPWRQDSIWHPLTEAHEKASEAQLEWASRSSSTSSIFDHLCSEDDDSPAAAVNPYHKTAQALIPLLDLECNDSTWMRYILFICQIDPLFKSLLARKDPWALLLLLYWYMKLCRGAWWVSSRCILQGKAICRYLERYHSDDDAVQAALTQPSIELEAARLEGWGGIAPSVGGI